MSNLSGLVRKTTNETVNSSEKFDRPAERRDSFVYVAQRFLDTRKLKPTSDKRGGNGGCALCIIQPFLYATVLCFTLAQVHQGDGILRFQLGCLLEVQERRDKVVLCDLNITEHEMTTRVRCRLSACATKRASPNCLDWLLSPHHECEPHLRISTKNGREKWTAREKFARKENRSLARGLSAPGRLWQTAVNGGGQTFRRGKLFRVIVDHPAIAMGINEENGPKRPQQREQDISVIEGLYC